MARKPKKSAVQRTSNGKSKPVSFRLDRTLVETIDGVATRLDVTRNGLVALVLKTYVLERGDQELARMIEREKAREHHVDLFA